METAGSHIYVVRYGGLYSHHGIDCGDGTVIHYGAPRLDQARSISRIGKQEFARGDTIQLRDYREFFDTLRRGMESDDFLTAAGKRFDKLRDSLQGLAIEDMDFSAEAIIARAQSRIGEKNFNLLFNNCEHFASWCVSGISNSKQLDNIWRATLSPAQLLSYSSRHWISNWIDHTPLGR